MPFPPHLALASVLACFVSAGMWVRSYRDFDRGFVCGRVNGDVQRVVDVSPALGQLSFTLERADGFSLGSGPREGARVYAEEVTLARRRPTRLGFAFEKQVATLTYDHTAQTPPVRTNWAAVVRIGRSLESRRCCRWSACSTALAGGREGPAACAPIAVTTSAPRPRNARSAGR